MKSKTMVRTVVALFLIVNLVAMIACAGGEQTFTGTVEKTDKGHVFKTSDGAMTYKLVANQDFSTMEGKTVKLTGTVMEREAGRAISVTRFEVVE